MVSHKDYTITAKEKKLGCVVISEVKENSRRT